ncbi:uncharacterized protein ACIBXB_016887 [Morphnus guianensis]
MDLIADTRCQRAGSSPARMMGGLDLALRKLGKILVWSCWKKAGCSLGLACGWGALGEDGGLRGCARGLLAGATNARRGQRGTNIACKLNPVSQYFQHWHRQQCRAAEQGRKYPLCPAQESSGSCTSMVPLAERSGPRGRAGCPPHQAQPQPLPCLQQPWQGSRGHRHSSCKLQGSCKTLFPNCPISWDQTRLLINPCFIIPGFRGPGQPQLSFTSMSRWQQWDPGPCPGHDAQRCSGDASVPAPKEPSALSTAGCTPRLPPALPLPTRTRRERTDQGRFWGCFVARHCPSPSPRPALGVAGDRGRGGELCRTGHTTHQRLFLLN